MLFKCHGNAKMNPANFLGTKSADLFQIDLKMQTEVPLCCWNTMQNSHEYHRLQETDFSSLKFLNSGKWVRLTSGCMLKWQNKYGNTESECNNRWEKYDMFKKSSSLYSDEFHYFTFIIIVSLGWVLDIRPIRKTCISRTALAEHFTHICVSNTLKNCSL